MIRRATLADVARKTGLNASTVSRALSRPERVNDETRRRVEQVAAELGYSPNIMARNLSRGVINTILVMAPNFADQALLPVFTDVLLGICNEAEAQGFNVMIQHHSASTIPPEDVVKVLNGGMIGGVILMATDHWKAVPEIGSGTQPPPIVSIMVDMTHLGLTSVVAQEAEGFSEMVDYLVRRGYMSFAYVSGPKGATHEKIRCRSVMTQLTTHGLGDRLIRLEGGPFDMASGARAAKAYLALHERPRAIICSSDALAVGFMHGIIAAGLSVPEDVAIVGYDGLDYSAFVTPTLTTMSQPSTEIGRSAMRSLADLILGQASTAQLIALRPKLLVRDSA
ncbi:transcriptional regulator [Gluconobacter oxydans]|uniref:LacI family DNA-binding transcriptional regulator n=1 Tax=Gluconobacter thailandicus TaxID=257438 RepID=UPI000299752A|nr:LacI family DNA-binding transcriptional regulator [Gluconobacter thailandicus]AFW02629.1 HTH-type transcriptional repressor CytR [Gluconobacter oxydans H24]ANQ41894.1 transcriptional regulator [Gluconobacter oxydans]